MHADNRSSLHRVRPVQILQMNHRITLVGVALGAGKHTRLTANAPRRIDEELHVCWNRHMGKRETRCGLEFRVQSSGFRVPGSEFRFPV
jgi:hypothetical protein